MLAKRVPCGGGFLRRINQPLIETLHAGTPEAPGERVLVPEQSLAKTRELFPVSLQANTKKADLEIVI